LTARAVALASRRGRVYFPGMRAGMTTTGLLATLAVAGPACRRGDADENRYQGVVEYEERDIAFEVLGRLIERPVVEGQVVKAGDLLARLDDTLEKSARDARAAEAQAMHDQLGLLKSGARAEDIRAMEAQVRAARASEGLLRTNLERTRKLFEGKAAPSASVDQMESDLNRAIAQRQGLEQNLSALRHGARPQEIEIALHRLASAEAEVALEDNRLQRYALRADRPGEVLQVHFELGEMAAVGTPMVTLADTNHPYVDVFVPEAEIGGIRVGAAARVRTDAAARELDGKVERISRRTEFTPRYLFSRGERTNLSIRVRVRVDDPHRELHAGPPAFVRVARGAAGSTPPPSEPTP
jgi:HlyD family secretion protein